MTMKTMFVPYFEGWQSLELDLLKFKNVTFEPNDSPESDYFELTFPEHLQTSMNSVVANHGAAMLEIRPTFQVDNEPPECAVCGRALSVREVDGRSVCYECVKN